MTQGYSLAPLILNVRTGEVMWIDATPSTKGYGHSVGRYGPRLGRVAADLWEHFDAGNQTSVLDILAWHAAARADRILVVHTDGTTKQMPTDDPPQTVAAIRAAAANADRSSTPASTTTAKIFAATLDPDRLASIVGAEIADGSLALVVDGQAVAPWTPVTAADLTAGLVPVPV